MTDVQPKHRRFMNLARLGFVLALLLAPLLPVPASAHELPPGVPPGDTPFVPGERYKPYAPEDPAYAIHYRPYVPARAVRHAPHRRVVHVHRPVRHAVARPHRHYHPKPALVAEHRHVRTKILRPRVVCANTYNYWGPERLCQMHP